MSTFLGEVCQTIFNKHQQNIDEIAIIIPNRRASVYIQQHLAKLFKAPFYAPKITTINEWVNENTTLKILNQTELLFLFYTIYVEVDKEEAEDFDSFLKWGKIILADFDEIDRYHISPKSIFKDLRNIKDIDNWSFDLTISKSKNNTLSDGQQKYADLWDKLPIYYEKLNTKLKEINATYQGRAYRDFSHSTQKLTLTPSTSLFKPKYKHYYFVGFNALSRSEEIIIENLNHQNICSLFFDVDTHYVNNHEHEAGHFYRKLKNKWKFKPDVKSAINSEPKHIQIIETAQQVAQAKIAGQIIKNLSPEDINKTAIVLADETLLIPLTKSLPIDLESANITMGYPIKYSHLKSLFDLIFDFQFKFKKFDSDKLYHKTLLKFIDHPFIQSLIKDQSSITKFEKNVIKGNQIFINHAELISFIPELEKIESLISVWHDNIPNGFKAIENFIQVLYDNFKNKLTKELELEILYHFTKGIQKFKQIWETYPHTISLKSFKTLFQQFWQNESLSFLGNPTHGLQVMGVLETRTLDFENLIILSMNEGNLPKNNFSNSLIPRELKIHHHLPIEQDRDAIFAHHFYRLLHRSKNIYLTYNSNSDGTKDGEKSRFITQLINELDCEKFNHSIQSFTYNAKDEHSKTSDTCYTVNDSVIKKLDALFERGLSPSALNTFIRCPLDFYYIYILGLREAKEVEENVEASTFGTMIHNVLERVYKDSFLTPNLALDYHILTKEKKYLKQYLEEEYLKTFSKSDIKYGQNKLSFEVSLKLLTKFIDKQIEELKAIDFPIYIKELEKTIEANYEWEIDGVKKSIKIKGNADRIEQFGPSYRIIDYKSGKCTTTKVSIKAPAKGKDLNLHTTATSKDKGYARQLLMYSLMFKAEFPKRQNFTTGIISMINLNQWLQNVHVSKSSHQFVTDEILDAFKDELKEIITQMYSKDFVYSHNEKSDYCDYCGV